MKDTKPSPVSGDPRHLGMARAADDMLEGYAVEVALESREMSNAQERGLA